MTAIISMTPHVGCTTPWGQAQSCTKIMDGLWEATTASHGGIYVSPDHMQRMPEQVTRHCQHNWFEEDCEWAIPFTCFADEIEQAVQDDKSELGLSSDAMKKMRYTAYVSLRDWYPDMFEIITGVKATPLNSRERAHKQFAEDTQTEWVVISAINSDTVPGMVECVAKIGGRANPDPMAVHKRFLVPATEYSKRSPFGFIVDPTRHAEQTTTT